jgi:hypothetical protein
MSIGLRTFFITLANQLFTSNATLANITGLSSPIAAGQTQKLRFWVPFSLGATGGVRALVTVPAGGTIYEATIKLFDGVTTALIIAERQAATVFTNALAVAGDHWLEIELTVVNGTTAGDVTLQMAQNTVDVLTLTVKRGASLEVVKL